jgi:hypothetical protein
LEYSDKKEANEQHAKDTKSAYDIPKDAKAVFHIAHQSA